MERGSDERKRGVYERASELHVGTEPVRGFTNDPENMGEGSRTCLFCCKARGRAGASDSVVRLRITATFESSTHDCGYCMIPRDGLAGVECGAKGGTRRNEKRITPRGDAGKLTFPQDVLDSLATFAAGASALIEDDPERVRADVPKDAAAQQPSTVVSDRQQHRALLVVELGWSK